MQVREKLSERAAQGIRCMLMRGGTSKGGYFLASDLPAKPTERDELLLRIMGSPDPAQIDGLGGAHPLTSKVAIVSRSAAGDADVDFLFAQVSVDRAHVDTTPNCGNILAGVGPFAIERGLVEASHPVTRVRVKILNTGTRAELVVSTPGGVVCYSGNEHIDGVPGTAAAVPINFLDAEGSVCGSLLPTGQPADTVCGVAVTCIDHGMPAVILRAADVGLTGYESCAEIEGAAEPLRKIEAIRLEAARLMGMGDVSAAVVPKVALISAPRQGGAIQVRCLIPKRCHTSIGVFAAVSVATACVWPGSVAQRLAVIPPGKEKQMNVEHPSGVFSVRLEMGGTEERPVVERAGIVRTARAIFDGCVFPREPEGRAEDFPNL
jgi:4-oxalomesaconate tautomerase